MSEPGNPFYDLLEIVQKRSESTSRDSFFIGKVTSENPLIIEAGGIPLSRGDFLISDHLLEGYERKIELNYPEESNLIKTKDGLKTGDQVLVLISADSQTFVVALRLI